MPIVSNVRDEPRYWPAVPERVWDSIREEFTLPTAAEMEAHFRSLGEPEGMRRTVRVFIGEETFCPGFQLKDGVLHEPVLRLFDHAMALKVPHNVFAAWMVSPLSAGACLSRTIDVIRSHRGRRSVIPSVPSKRQADLYPVCCPRVIEHYDSSETTYNNTVRKAR